jgi:hypothetical protein
MVCTDYKIAQAEVVKAMFKPVKGMSIVAGQKYVADYSKDNLLGQLYPQRGAARSWRADLMTPWMQQEMKILKYTSRFLN